MSEEKHCSKCGKPVPGESPRGICPACLMEQAMASRTIVTGQPDAELPPPPSPEEIADKFPQYEVLECLGRGGMGVVYQARQKSLDRWVAIKVLAPERVHEERFAEHFEREAKTLAKMSHPNIVTVFDHGETGGLFYIVMEFVDGVNLRDLLREGKMEPEQALAIIPPICEALQYAHDKGVVHRDIKPENILLDRDGRVKIADFGIASLVGASGENSGTPPYMAPEQSGGTVDRRADIYALGVVLYEMLTGERPEKDLVAPSKRVEVSVKIDEMVLRALETEPERRYQTAGEFRTMVETINSEMGSTSGGTGALPEPRFSRAAIVGACWAPLILFAYIMWFSDSVSVPLSPGEKPPGPSWWQYLMMFTLLPLGIASPFGTTILGWVSVSQIRRSAGKLHGMWLAVFDGLLFPLLLLTGLIGWFWHWVFYDLIRATLITGEPEISSLEQIFVNNAMAFTVMATLVSSMVVGFITIRMVWRAVTAGDSSAQPTPRNSSTGRAIAIGCGVLALGGVVVVGLGVVLPLILRYKNAQYHERFLAENQRQFAESIARAEQNEAQLEETLVGYDWEDLAKEGHLVDGVVETVDGRTALKIENLQNGPRLQARLLTIENPPIKGKRYAIKGAIRYENVEGAAYLEMWNNFPHGRFFSRTLDAPGSGPLSQITGNSDWRPFILPFDQTGSATPPNRIEVNLHLPGRGVVFLGPLELVEFSTDNGTPELSSREENPHKTAIAELKIKQPDGSEEVGSLRAEGIDLLQEVLSREPDHVVPADRGASLEPAILLEWQGNQYAVQSDKIVLIGEEEWTMWLSPGIDEKLIEHSDARVIRGTVVGVAEDGRGMPERLLPLAGAAGMLALSWLTFLMHRRINRDRRLEKTALFLCVAGVILPLLILIGHLFGMEQAVVATVAYVLFAVMQLAALILGIIRFSEPLGRAAAIASGVMLLVSALFLS